jgi:hypothetical protein
MLALLLGLLTSTAHAEPMHTTLDDVLAQSTDIVIATYLGPVGSSNAFDATGSRLRIERALRGSLRGEITAGVGTGHADLQAGSRVIAFLNHERRWSYIGEAPAGARLEDRVSLRGFYDFNAHIVTPSMTTLDELTGRLTGNPLEWHVEGPLVALADDGSRIVETRYRIRVDATENGATTVTGLPIRNLPAPAVRFGGWEDIITITWRSSWPRPLVIRGEVTGRNAGVQTARFWIEQPDLVRERDIRAYLTNRNAAYPYYRMPLRWDDGEQWSVTIGDDYSSLTFWRGGREVDWSTVDIRVNRRIEGAMGVMTLAPARPGPLLDTRGDARVLLQELLRGPIEVHIGARRGQLQWGTVEMRPAIRAR